MKNIYTHRFRTVEDAGPYGFSGYRQFLRSRKLPDKPQFIGIAQSRRGAFYMLPTPRADMESVPTVRGWCEHPGGTPAVGLNFGYQGTSERVSLYHFLKVFERVLGKTFFKKFSLKRAPLTRPRRRCCVRGLRGRRRHAFARRHGTFHWPRRSQERCARGFVCRHGSYRGHAWR